MISMFSKIKNHALVTGYQSNSKTNSQTSTTNTLSTSSSGDQSTSSTSSTTKPTSKTPTTATLNSISSNINSLQNATCTTNYSNDSAGKSGPQTNIYGRSGVNAPSKVNLAFLVLIRFKLVTEYIAQVALDTI